MASSGDLDDPRHGLPPVDTKRWVVSRKARVLQAIEDGTLTRVQACARYNISEAELRLWERAVACAGVPGLRVTRVQIYRDAFEAGSILPSARLSPPPSPPPPPSESSSPAARAGAHGDEAKPAPPMRA